MPAAFAWLSARMEPNNNYHLISSTHSDMIKKEISERGFVYETICYGCIALAIAGKIVIANAIPENKIIGRQTWAIGEQKKFCPLK